MSSRADWLFPAAILAAGILRLALTASGVPNAAAKYASMTVVILAGCIYFGVRARSYREIFKYAYILIVPYMLVELAGIGYTWGTGRATIFHAPEYSFNSPIHVHFWGHLLGGLTWEPLALVIVMTIVRLLYRSWIRIAGRTVVRHSYLKATIGSTRDARRAGM